MSDSRAASAPRLSCPMKAPGTSLERHQGRLFIADPSRDIAVPVNESAAAVWELCDGTISVDEMVRAICELASIPADHARNDVESTIDELARAGLISSER